MASWARPIIRVWKSRQNWTMSGSRRAWKLSKGSPRRAESAIRRGKRKEREGISPILVRRKMEGQRGIGLEERSETTLAHKSQSAHNWAPPANKRSMRNRVTWNSRPSVKLTSINWRASTTLWGIYCSRRKRADSISSPDRSREVPNFSLRIPVCLYMVWWMNFHTQIIYYKFCFILHFWQIIIISLL